MVFAAWVNGSESTPAITYVHTQLEPGWLLHTYVCMYVCTYVGGHCYMKSIMELMQPLHLPSVELQDNQKITKQLVGKNTMLHHKEKGF